MKRYGSIIRVKPEKFDEYKKLHAAAKASLESGEQAVENFGKVITRPQESLLRLLPS